MNSTIDSFDLADRLNRTKDVVKEDFIMDKCKNMHVLDLGCIRHNADFAFQDPNWLHGKIKQVAKRLVGVDYLLGDIEKLNTAGYNIVYGDVTKPLEISDDAFDVIVAGDLIEHLTNFEGFFENCRRFLKPNGFLIITTPNPFYAGEFHYIAFKQHILINPEHTCWIDPLALVQLSKRFNFNVENIYYINRSWNLGNLICQKKNNQYDILNGKWVNNNFVLKVLRVLISHLFNLFYVPFRFFSGSMSHLVRHSDYLAVLKRDK